MKQQHYLGQKTVVPLKANILSLFPEHNRYYELFGGTGEILKSKKAVKFQCIVDIDNCVICDYKKSFPPSTVVVNDCSISFLDKLYCDKNTLIYADPPYRLSSRTSKYRYNFELTDKQHLQFLAKVKKLDCRVVISHYSDKLYDKILLPRWSKIVIPISYRGSVKQEALYFNFPFDIARHQPELAGKNKTDRQRIKRKASRWVNNYMKLPDYERQAILTLIHSSHK